MFNDTSKVARLFDDPELLEEDDLTDNAIGQVPEELGAVDKDYVRGECLGLEEGFHADVVDDFDAVEALELTPSKPGRRARSKKGERIDVLKPNGEPKSIYECLVEYGLLRKMTDIVMAKVAVPWYLRADAAQEMHCTWASLKAKPTFERNQLAHYAYLSGQHSSLKLRRMIGAVVVIPGALFRNGRDSAFMESIGAAVNPKDVEDYKDSLELSVEMGDRMENARVSEQLFKERLGGINLSAKQRSVAEKALLKRMSVDDIATEMCTSVANVERLINQITAKLHAKQ